MTVLSQVERVSMRNRGAGDFLGYQPLFPWAPFLLRPPVLWVRVLRKFAKEVSVEE